MRNNDEKISDNIDKSNENNKTVTMTGEGGSQEKKSAKTEQETTTNGGIETSKQLPRRDENPFSFKHFLSNASASASASNINNATATVTSSTTSNSSRILDLPLPQSTPSSVPYQSATGARPKVPQSASMSTTLANSGGASSSAADSLSSKMKRSPRFSSFDSQASLAEAATSDLPTSSQQNYANPTVENAYDHVQRSYSHYDMDYPRSRNLNGHRRNSPTSTSPHNRDRASNPEFAAAALPDFVQDHWMDQWYYKDHQHQHNLNSPPNSPTSPIRIIPFMEDFADVNPQPQTLPDFLSDGPIIHSSGRLADVASGLPNLDSPEDDSPNLLASRLQLENDRLRREVNEIRLSLGEQTRRNHELERSLEQRRTEVSSSSNRENDEAKKLINKLKQQVKDLSSQVQTLRSENESLREFGAVGGCSSSSSSRPKPSRSQELSQELQMAASTAEIHLRQLLSGVENLRVLAATLESMGSADTSPNQDDFIYNCDDFDN